MAIAKKKKESFLTKQPGPIRAARSFAVSSTRTVKTPNYLSFACICLKWWPGTLLSTNPPTRGGFTLLSFHPRQPLRNGEFLHEISFQTPRVAHSGLRCRDPGLPEPGNVPDFPTTLPRPLPRKPPPDARSFVRSLARWLLRCICERARCVPGEH